MEVWIVPDASWTKRDALPAFPPVARDWDALRITPETLKTWVDKEQTLHVSVTAAPVRVHMPLGLSLREDRLIRRFRERQPQTEFVFYTAKLSGLQIKERRDHLCVPSFYLRNQYRKRFGQSVASIRIRPPAVATETPHRWSEEGMRVRETVRRDRGWQNRNVLLVDVSQATETQRLLLKQEWSAFRHRDASLVVHGLYRPTPIRQRWPLYLAADWLWTASSSSRSLCPMHAVAMATGLPIVTFDLGDHGEWVRHAHNGLVLHPVYWRAEWRRYLSELLANPAWSRDLGRNARAMAERYLIPQAKGGM